MKIPDVRIHKVIVPMKPDTVNSPGVEDKLNKPDPITGRSLNFWEFPKWIIELVADNGVVGLGEPRRGDLYEPLRRQADMIIGKTSALHSQHSGTPELPAGSRVFGRLLLERL